MSNTPLGASLHLLAATADRAPSLRDARVCGHPLYMQLTAKSAEAVALAAEELGMPIEIETTQSGSTHTRVSVRTPDVLFTVVHIAYPEEASA